VKKTGLPPIAKGPRGATMMRALVALLLISCSSPSESPDDLPADGEEEHGEEAGHDEHEKKVALSPEAIATVDLQTAVVERRSIADEIEATAVLEPNAYALAHVSPRIAGRAIEVHAVLGQRVEAGQILAELDSIELGERKAAFLQAGAELDVARRNYEREKRLFEGEISSEKEYLEAKGDHQRAQASSRAAREALRLVGLTDEEIDRVTWGGRGEPLSHFPLTAPFGGTVIERHITLGELITPEDKPFTVADLSTAWILLSVYEKDLARVEVGQDVGIRVDAYPAEYFEGTLTYLSEVVDPKTRTATARVEVPNPRGRLKPGMFARAVVRVPSAERKQALVVPKEAVQSVDGNATVFVAEGERTFEVREIETGRTVSGLVEILSGVSEGDRIVTRGAFYLKSEISKEEMSGHSH
jgi:membrane fusion protein, heavy metal efflux system